MRTPGAEADLADEAEIFHERTKYHRGTFLGPAVRIARFLTRPGLVARAAAGHHDFPHLEPIELPEPGALPARLDAVLRARVSSRELAGPLELAEVSTLLHHALRCNRRQASPAAPGVEFHFRPYPSAGGLNALEAYVFLGGVAGAPGCAAHYDARRHRLRLLRRFAADPLPGADTAGAAGGVAAPLAVVLSMLPQRLTAKYGERGYRFALLEAGHAAQNLCLAAGALGWGSLVYGSFFDAELESLLGLDGVTETVATAVLLGRGKEPVRP